MQQWSFGVQRQIGQPWVAEIDYVGTKSTHLDVIRNYNQPIIAGWGQHGAWFRTRTSGRSSGRRRWALATTTGCRRASRGR